MSLTNYVIMEGKDYQSICDTLRTQKQTNNLYTAKEISSNIEELVGKYIEKTLNGNIVNDKATKVGPYAFYGSDIISVSLPNAIEIGIYAFCSCPNLISVDLPKATKILPYSFSESNIVSMVLPSADNINGYAFQYSNIQKLDLPKVIHIGAGAFEYCENLSTIILRSNTMVTVSGDPFGSSSGQGKYFYVPKAIINNYKQSTGYWSSYKNQFRAIEDYPEICG